MNAATIRAPRAGAGFSITELLIAMTLGLVLISAAMSMLLATTRTNAALDSVSRLQEAGRFALFQMERDIRAAGYKGCAHVARINRLIATPALPAEAVLFDFDQPFYGWREAAIAGLPTGRLSTALAANYARGDVLLVKNAGEPLGVRLSAVVERDAVTFGITPAIVRPFSQLLLIANCAGSADLFQVATNATEAGAVLGRQTAVEGLWPGNLNPTANWFSSRYQPTNAELTLAQSNLYYVGYRRGSDGQRSTETSLRRIRFGLGGLLRDDELVAGVYDLRVQYGLDPIRRGGTDTFLPADQLSTDNWGQVVAIRLGLLTYNGDENDRYSADLIAPQVFDTSLWDFSGARLLTNPSNPTAPPRFVPPDSRIYRFFSTTVAVRNRVSWQPAQLSIAPWYDRVACQPAQLPIGDWHV